MGIISKMRKQAAVWWPVDESNAWNESSYGNPVAIKCRWEDKVEEFVDKTGTRQLSKSVIYVDRVMKLGDLIWLGAIADAPATPYGAAGVGVIARVEAMPNLRNTEVLHTVWI